MRRKNRRGHITRTRNRYAREVAKAWHRNQKCYIVLRITGGPSHASIVEDWDEQRADCRSRLPIDFKVFGLEGEPLTYSERHYCLPKEDALLADGRTLRHPLVASAGVPSSESYLWHFGGGLELPGGMLPREVAFCEYNAKSRRGAIIITFDGELMPLIYLNYHHLLYDVRVFKEGELEWLRSNW